MIRMVYIKVGQSPQIVNGLDYGKTCTKPYKKISSKSNRDGYPRLASIGHVLMTQSQKLGEVPQKRWFYRKKIGVQPLLQGKWVWFKKLALKAGTAPVHSPTTQKSSPRFCGQRIQQTFCMSLGHFDTPISWVYPILSPILGRCSRTRGAWQIAAPHSVTRDLKSPQNDLFFVLTSDFESTIFPDFS